MNVTVQKVELKVILPFRLLFLQECNFQIRYNACHERNWTDSYLISVGNVAVGYGSIKGKDNSADRDAVFEFYVVPHVRDYSGLLFKKLLEISSARFIECQSNDSILTPLLHEFSQNIESDVILFADDKVTHHKMPDVIFRKRKENDVPFEHTSEPVGDYILDKDGEVVATGGFLLHYNIPFADLYMEVKENYRGRGLGSFLLQEVKKACYQSGRVPAARCNIQNLASKACLIKAGLHVCGQMQSGNVSLPGI